MGEQARRPLVGLLRLLVLSLLMERDVHGYEIMSSVEELTGGYWRPKPGALYPLLSDMARRGLVKAREEVVSGRRRVVYSITEEGVKEYIKHLRGFRRVVAPVVRRIIEGGVKGLKRLDELGVGGEELREELSGIVKGLRRLVEQLERSLEGLSG